MQLATLCAICIALLLAVPSLFAQEQATGNTSPDAVAKTPLSQKHLERLDAIAEQISAISTERESLQKLLEQGDNPDVQDDLAAVNRDIATLRASFELLVLDDVATDVLQQPESETFDWQQELVDIATPLIDSLKSLTERPRQLAGFRSQVALYKQKMSVADDAIETITSIPEDQLGAASATRLQDMLADWQSQRTLYENQLLTAQVQLEKLEAQDTGNWQGIWPAVKSFLLGRGLTLLLAGLAALAAWLVMSGIWWLYNNKLTTRAQRRKSTRYRLLAYSYYLLTLLAIVASVLLVLNIREDLLLLALAFIILFGAALSLRTFLPRFFQEAKLLLNLGAVREEESVVVGGIPWQVKSLNLQTVLHNPALDGILRLPLDSVSSLVSRPTRDDLWFPTHTGDYIILPDDRFAQVLRQTPDMVELSVRGGMRMTFATPDFYTMKITNLSRGDSYGVAMTYGLDYSLQDQCLDVIPATLKQALHDAFADAQMDDNIIDIMVEFQSAGASSLDFLIYVTARSEAANSYYKIQRVVEQTALAMASEHNWGIPFPQMTVHHQPA